MKYSAAIFAALVAVAAAQSSGAATAASPSPTVSKAPTPQELCLKACDQNAPDYSTCQAHCQNVPAPNESMVNANTECAAKCDQGKGTPEDTKKYAECQDNCITKHFMPSQTAGAGSATKTDTSSGSDDSSDGAETSETDASSSSTESSSAKSSDNPNAAGALAVSGGAGILAVVAAVLAL